MPRSTHLHAHKASMGTGNRPDLRRRENFLPILEESPMLRRHRCAEEVHLKAYESKEGGSEWVRRLAFDFVGKTEFH